MVEIYNAVEAPPVFDSRVSKTEKDLPNERHSKTGNGRACWRIQTARRVRPLGASECFQGMVARARRLK